MRKTVQVVAMRYDAFAIDIVQDLAHLLGRELVMIQKGNEASDGALEVDVVLPESVVGVDEEGLGHASYELGALSYERRASQSRRIVFDRVQVSKARANIAVAMAHRSQLITP